MTRQELTDLCEGVDFNIIASELTNEKLAQSVGNGYYFIADKEHSHVTKDVILAIENSKTLLAKLKLLSNDLEKSVERHKATAVKHQKNKKHKEAILEMKRSKIEDDKYQKITKLHDSIEMSILNLDSADINAFVVRQMTAINKLSKTQLSIDNIDNIVDEYQETVQTNNEISQTLSHASATNDFDDDELENELNKLVNEEDEGEYIKVPKKPISTNEEPITYGFQKRSEKKALFN